MSDHARTRRAAPRTGRLRALLGWALRSASARSGTFAYWTDEVAISGTTFSSGTLDLRVNNVDTYPTTTLSMTNMVPGVSSAEVLTVKNQGTAPLKYTLTGGLAGADAVDYNTYAALKISISLGGSRTAGVGTSFTCTGGTPIITNVTLTSTTTATIIAQTSGCRDGPECDRSALLPDHAGSGSGHQPAEQVGNGNVQGDGNF